MQWWWCDSGEDTNGACQRILCGVSNPEEISDPKYVFWRCANVVGNKTGLQRPGGQLERSDKEGKKVSGETNGCFLGGQGPGI